MDKGTLMDVVAIIDATIEALNKDKKAIDASGYSVLDKRISTAELNGAINALNKLSNHLQKGIEADISAMENKGSE